VQRYRNMFVTGGVLPGVARTDNFSP